MPYKATCTSFHKTCTAAWKGSHFMQGNKADHAHVLLSFSSSALEVMGNTCGVERLCCSQNCWNLILSFKCATCSRPKQYVTKHVCSSQEPRSPRPHNRFAKILSRSVGVAALGIKDEERTSEALRVQLWQPGGISSAASASYTLYCAIDTGTNSDACSRAPILAIAWGHPKQEDVASI